MSKLKYNEDLYRIIFFWLGIAFIFMGCLSYIGILKPKENSMVQNRAVLGFVFGLVGIAFLIVQIVFQVVATNKKKLHSKLIASGNKVNGVVEKVYLQKYTQYGRKCPYRCMYTYSYQGKVYRKKSYLLWEKPNLLEGDSLVVYVNDFGKSTVLL